MTNRLLRISFAAAVLVACAGPNTTTSMQSPDPMSSRTPSFPPRLTREVSPFPVLDEAGTPYDHPFLGGFNIPRPQLVDIDDDGDLDLFVQETPSAVIWFENVGTVQNPTFRWRTDQYGNIDVGEWYRFVDMDGDGDNDLLTERLFSYVTYYRNEGSSLMPAFRVLADTLRDSNGVPIFSDRQNIPNVSEIDCDGNLDLLIGRLVGSITRYEESGVGPDGAPRFRHVMDDFEGISIVAQIGSKHGANTLALADIDNDGDQDLFWGDFFEQGLLMIENTGSCSNPVYQAQPTQFPIGDPVLTSGYNAPTFGDIDGDGDLDVLIGVLGGAYNPNATTATNMFFLENLGEGNFAERSQAYVRQIDVGSESIPTFVDLDDDGDLDMLVPNKIDQNNLETSLIYRFENTGTAREPRFELTGTWDIEGLYHYAPSFGDIDNDGDLDMVMGSWKDEIALFMNEGSKSEPDFVLADSAMVEITRGSNTTPQLVDIDDDGDLDLFIGESSGAVNFYRNIGTPSQHEFELVSDKFQGIDVGRRSFPVFVDLNYDGTLDMVVGSEAGDVKFYANNGTSQEPVFELDTSFSMELRPYSTPTFVDIDADGDLDVFSGGTGGGVVFYENHDTP
jgi:hypothetical protein